MDVSLSLGFQSEKVTEAANLHLKQLQILLLDFPNTLPFSLTNAMYERNIHCSTLN